MSYQTDIVTIGAMIDICREFYDRPDFSGVIEDDLWTVVAKLQSILTAMREGR